MLVVGLGHLYLRRWVRAVWWAGLAILVGSLFVPPETLTALRSGEPVTPRLLAPVLGIVVFSATDAFVVAVRDRRAGTGHTPEDSCPNCGKSVDEDLDFCQWCSADLTASDE